MQSQFEDYEDLTGLRFAWNAFPANQKDEQRCVVPVSCLYQPLRPKDSPVIVEMPPVACRNCRAILCPGCHIDLATNVWSCPFCLSRNQLAGPPANELPFAASPDAQDIEYVVEDPAVDPRQFNPRTLFVYVVDTCFEEPAEFESLKESLSVSLSMLPEDAFVAFITFGKHVNVYEIGRQDCQRFYAFNGQKKYTQAEVAKKLEFSDGGAPERFAQPYAACEFNLAALIEGLQPDAFRTPKYFRKTRATGCAVNVAVQMLSRGFPHSGARVFLFSAGPCTVGPGQIVGTPLKEPLRSHHDIAKDAKAEKQYKESSEFYTGIAELAARNGHTVDVFIGSYDQVGLSEMEALADKTGGVVVQSDSFSSAIFKRSLQKVLQPDETTQTLSFGLNGTLQVKVTRNLRIRGAIGHMTAVKGTKSASVAEKNPVGVAGTDAWKIGAVWPHSAYAFFFELAESTSNVSYLQFITTYQHADGSRRVHVTTATRPTAPSGSAELIANFDQEAAAVIVARQTVWKSVRNERADSSVAVAAIDRVLVGLCKHFATYRTNEENTFSLPASLNLFPQFAYHLRRSPFIQVFNSSPDETSYYRHCFLAEDCTSSLIMVQPTLTSYHIEGPPEPVVLDSTSLKPDRILLLDTFFHLLIYHGATVADWKRAGYQDQPDYAYVKDFMAQPREEAAEILVDRFPLPRFIDTEEGGSQARFLMSRLSPTTSYRNVDTMLTMAGADGEKGAVIMTDDVSLPTFMEYVKKAVVKPE